MSTVTASWPASVWRTAAGLSNTSRSLARPLRIDTEVNDRLESFRQAALRRTTIPGVSDAAAAVIVTEIGVDMTRFPTAAHLSWAGLCPRNDEIAGKRCSTKLRKGAPWLKTLLVSGRLGGEPQKAELLCALFTRITARRGPYKAVVAVAAAILTTVY
jgi:transposase